MTKKDYEAIASVLAKYGEIYIRKSHLVESLADLFEAENERFDRDKFFKACYAGEIKIAKGG